METIHVKRGTDRTIDRMCEAVGYNGTKVQIIVETGKIRLSGQYWDGGSRSTYSAHRLIGGVEPIALPEHDRMAPAPEFEIPEGVAIVEHRIFCGKDMGIRIHVKKENAAPLLPPKLAISVDEKIVLAATRSLKPSYNGISNYRYHAAHEETGIDLGRWECAKASCIAMGLLNKAGAITVDGRNAIERTDLYQLRKALEGGAL